MPNIGNDIVDLSLAKTESNWQRKGFLEKQFTLKEQQEIHHSTTPFLKVWQFWSMKEAAYKCYTQKVEKRFFAPKKLECFLTSKDDGFVIFEDVKFYTITFFSEFYIHTIAKSIQRKIEIFSNIGLSKKVDHEMILKLAGETRISSKKIEKRRTLVGAPLYYSKEKKLTKSCSISHHGNYGAFAFTLNNES